MLRLIKLFFKAPEKQKSTILIETEGKLKNMLFKSRSHPSLLKELLNITHFEKRKFLIQTLYLLASSISPYQKRTIKAQKAAITMLQDLFIQTIHEQVIAIGPMDEHEKNIVYLRLLKPARESGLLNHGVSQARRMELKSLLSITISKLNQITPIDTTPTPPPENNTETKQEKMLH